jgi:hypothetical protein
MSRKSKVRIAFGLTVFVTISLGILAFFATNRLFAQGDGYIFVRTVTDTVNCAGGGGGDTCVESTTTCDLYCLCGDEATGPCDKRNCVTSN